MYLFDKFFGRYQDHYQIPMSILLKDHEDFRKKNYNYRFFKDNRQIEVYDKENNIIHNMKTFKFARLGRQKVITDFQNNKGKKPFKF